MLLLSDYQHRHALELILETVASSCSRVTCFDEFGKSILCAYGMQWWQLHIRYGVTDYPDTIISVPSSVLNRVFIITAALPASSALSMMCGSKLI